MKPINWKVKCLKCHKPGVGVHKGKVYCTQHLLEAQEKDKKGEKCTN